MSLPRTPVQDIMDMLLSFDDNALLIKQAGIHCPPGCGVCCASHEVDASVFELLPLAHHLWQNGLGEETLLAAKEKEFDSVCLFFHPDGADTQQLGCCRFYQWRPSVCRLFGNSAVRNKKGIPQFAACRVIKQTAKEELAALALQLENGLPLAVFSEASQQMTNMDPTSGGRRLPINRAVLEALEKVGMEMQWESEKESID